MRNLFIIAVLLLVAFMAGWFTVNRNGDRTTIEINQTEIRQDTREVIDRGRDLLQQHQHEHDGMHSLRDSAAELLNQGTAAPQAGNWGGEAGQAGYQNFIPEQRIGAQPNSVQPWQQVAPTSNW